MKMPEYLLLFSQSGSVDVRVRLEGHDGCMPGRKMSPSEIATLVADNGATFHQRMTFDDRECSVSKYEIDPVNNQLTIFARPIR